MLFQPFFFKAGEEFRGQKRKGGGGRIRITTSSNSVYEHLELMIDWFWIPIFRSNQDVRNDHKLFIFSPGTVKSMIERSRAHSRFRFVSARSWYKGRYNLRVRTHELLDFLTNRLMRVAHPAGEAFLTPIAGTNLLGGKSLHSPNFSWANSNLANLESRDTGVRFTLFKFIAWGCGVDAYIPQIFERLFLKKKRTWKIPRGYSAVNCREFETWRIIRWNEFWLFHEITGFTLKSSPGFEFWDSSENR